MDKKELIDRLNEMESQNTFMQASTENNSKEWHLFEDIDDRIHDLLTIFEGD